MSAWGLPEALEVGGVHYAIRTDFRVILEDIFPAFSDPELDSYGVAMVLLEVLYIDYDTIPEEHKQEAVTKALEFIEAGIKEDKSKPKIRSMDWEQDAPLIIPAVNRVAGCEVRTEKHVHWWTFIGYYMEIRESLFSQIVSIRTKRAKGKKLEKYEEEFVKENRELITLKQNYSEEEEQAKAELIKLLDGRR